MADPDWEALDRRVPARLADLLRRCLDRDPRQRLQDVGEALIALEAYLREPAAPGAIDAGASARPAALRPWIPLLALLAGGVLASIAWWASDTEAPPPALGLRVSVLLPPGEFLATSSAPGSVLALEAGRGTLVYSAARGDAGRHLLRRPLEAFEAEAIPATEGAGPHFLSPDGRWLGYFVDASLYKRPLEGGQAQLLTTLPASWASDVWGATWGSDGTIVFNILWSGLHRTSERGGDPEQVLAPDTALGEVDIEFPHFLPDGRSVLYTVWRGLLPGSCKIGLLDLATGVRKTLLEEGSDARYVPTGHLVFGRSAGVFVVPFDLESREVRGQPVPLPLQVLYDREIGAVHLAFDENGTLAFVPLAGVPQNRLVAVDLDGDETELFPPPTPSCIRATHPTAGASR
jgi:serine/threonine-protein kinase